MPSLPTTILNFVDGDFTVVNFNGLPLFHQPFNGDSGEYLLEQRCIQFAANFNATALNTAYPLAPYASYILVSEGPLQDLGGGLVQWNQIYALLPATRNDYSSISYNFIGYFGKVASLATVSSTQIVGRPRATYSVKCRIQNDYYFCATGQTYTTPAAIPIIYSQLYYIPQGTISGSTFTPTYTRGSANDIATGSTTDYIWTASQWNNTIPTYPSTSEYQALILAGTEIVAENSQISRWQGNIYQRQTKYVVAQ